jgi:hypothetical protein
LAKLFSDILEKGVKAGQVPARTEAAREWYRNQAKKVSKSAVQEKALVAEMRRDGRTRTRVLYGRMYMFIYDPKHKETLPYYDKFPLIFPINKAEGGFLGLNMHYLPPVFRAKLMDSLYDVISNDKYDETTRLRMNYDLLNGAAKFRYFRPTIKHYLVRHMKSQLMYVKPEEWDVALFLPTRSFVNATYSKVYADSRKIIRGLG